MEKLHFTIEINAPRKKVWKTMLDDDSYRIWTEVFMPGGYYVGDWTTGSKILFLAPDKTGAIAGMVSRIRENRKYEFISIEHMGIVEDGKEDISSEAVKDWAGAQENYTFEELDGTTHLLVELDSADKYKEMFQDIWPKALQKLKQLIEKSR
jgi:uncharacterized protein YndB with AHSA1/START domain